MTMERHLRTGAVSDRSTLEIPFCVSTERPQVQGKELCAFDASELGVIEILNRIALEDITMTKTLG